jgi:hypothetical protein
MASGQNKVGKKIFVQHGWLVHRLDMFVDDYSCLNIHFWSHYSQVALECPLLSPFGFDLGRRLLCDILFVSLLLLVVSTALQNEDPTTDSALDWWLVITVSIIAVPLLSWFCLAVGVDTTLLACCLLAQWHLDSLLVHNCMTESRSNNWPGLDLCLVGTCLFHCSVVSLDATNLSRSDRQSLEKTTAPCCCINCVREEWRYSNDWQSKLLIDGLLVLVSSIAVPSHLMPPFSWFSLAVIIERTRYRSDVLLPLIDCAHKSPFHSFKEPLLYLYNNLLRVVRCDEMTSSLNGKNPTFACKSRRNKVSLWVFDYFNPDLSPFFPKSLYYMQITIYW